MKTTDLKLGELPLQLSLRLANATPFTIDIPQATLNTIRQRVQSYQWYNAPSAAQNHTDDQVYKAITLFYMIIRFYLLDES